MAIIFLAGVKPMERLNRNMDKLLYRIILKDKLEPDCFGAFIHYNDPKYTAKVVKISQFQPHRKFM